MFPNDTLQMLRFFNSRVPKALISLLLMFVKPVAHDPAGVCVKWPWLANVMQFFLSPSGTCNRLPVPT